MSELEQQPPPPQPTDSPPPRGSGVAWAIAFSLVSISAIAAITFLLRQCSPAHISQNIATGLAQAFQPQINANTVINTTLNRMADQSKLVVLSASVNVEITKSDEKVIWGVPLGTTVVALRARDNRVQYYVPLTNISKGDFKYDDVHKRLTLRVPKPVVDKDLVEVQSDPSKIEVRTDVGWARFDRFSGQILREQAQRELRPVIILEAKNPLYIDKAKTNAREALKKLLEPMASKLKDDVEMEIEFK